MTELDRDRRDYSRQFVSQVRIPTEPDDPLESRGKPKPVMIGTSTERQTNIRAITAALGIVDRLRGVSFDWKLDGKHDIGLIPEEVAEVLPEAVGFDGNAKDAKAIDYSPLVAVLVEAMKEKQVQIKNHEQSLKEPKAQAAR